MPTQDNRHLAIAFDGQPADKLLLRSFSINEQLGRLFEIEVGLDSQDSDINFENVVGKLATVQFTNPKGAIRYFNGVVSRFVQEQQGKVPRYQATLSPWLWLLTRTADCKIFQNQNVPDIIKAVFTDHGIASQSFQFKLSASYGVREYCVQYRETAFNFVSRLMEEEGIYYFFEHSDDKHVMVLVDAPSQHDAFPGYDDNLEYQATGAPRQETVTDWIVQKEIQTGAYTLNDYNFTKPSMDLKANDQIQRKHEHSSYEVYDYPGGYTAPADGTTYAKIRIQELQSQYEIVHANTTSCGIAAGYKFTQEGHPRSDQKGDYLTTRMTLQMTAASYASGGGGGGGEFSCNFSAMPLATPPLPFRTPRTTPKPMIRGPQTAIVTGASGDEICVDEYGRIKVHFYWDRSDKKDDTSSCWIRVSQYWAGAAWGSIHPPRVGQEVIVEFLEGDPDRPIVTGRVYNGTNTVPYALPANKTQSGIKSNSSTGGGGSNEIRFEDKKGSEEVYIHAQKDQNIKVENDETTSIGNNRTETVGKDESITINGNRTESVAKDESITISGGRTESVSKDENISIDGGRTESVGKDESITIDGGRTESVGKDESITIDGGRTESVGKDESVSVTGGRSVSVGKDDGLNVTGNLSIQADKSITITCGSASITMNSDGTIQINGKDVNIEGSGKIQAKASSDLILKGSSIAGN